MNTTSPSSPDLRDGQPLPGAFGGNLARVLSDAPSASAGHFLFREPAALPSPPYALIRRISPLALSAKPLEETPYTD